MFEVADARFVKDHAADRKIGGRRFAAFARLRLRRRCRPGAGVVGWFYALRSNRLGHSFDADCKRCCRQGTHAHLKHSLFRLLGFANRSLRGRRSSFVLDQPNRQSRPSRRVHEPQIGEYLEASYFADVAWGCTKISFGKKRDANFEVLTGSGVLASSRGPTGSARPSLFARIRRPKNAGSG